MVLALKPMYKWKTTEEQNLSTYNYSVLIFNKDAKDKLWRKGRKSGILSKWSWKHWKNYIRSIGINFHKSNSQWIKDLNVEPKTLTVLGENIGCNLLVIVWKGQTKYDPICMRTLVWNWQVGLHKTFHIFTANEQFNEKIEGNLYCQKYGLLLMHKPHERLKTITFSRMGQGTE